MAKQTTHGKVAVNFLLEESERDKLREQAVSNGRSLASEIRMLIRSALTAQR